VLFTVSVVVGVAALLLSFLFSGWRAILSTRSTIFVRMLLGHFTLSLCIQSWLWIASHLSVEPAATELFPVSFPELTQCS